MLVRLTCGCKKSWFVDDSLAGTPVQCKSCGKSVIVPGGTDPEPAPSPAPDPIALGPAPVAQFPAPPARPLAAPDLRFFIAYEYPKMWGDNKLYRVYRREEALLFLHLGIFLDGVDFAGLARTQSGQSVAVMGVGLLVAGAQKITAKMEEPKLRKRLAQLDSLNSRELLLEAGKKPSFVAPVKDMTEVKFVPWDGFKKPWATNGNETLCSFRFKLQSGGKHDITLKDTADLQAAIAWTREMLGPDKIQIGFPVDSPAPPSRYQ